MPRVLDLTNSHPFYVQVLGEELCKASPGPEIDEATCKEVVQETLLESAGKLHLYFQNLFDRCVKSSAGNERVLVALAAGPQKVSEVARSLGKSTGEVSAILGRLMQVDVVRREGEAYALTDPVFARWIVGTRSDLAAYVGPALLGSETERAIAQKLALEGFRLIYQSRASRGVFDLLVLLNTYEIGLQVKRTAAAKFYLAVEEYERMKAEGTRLGWQPVLALYRPEGDEARYFRLEDLAPRPQSYLAEFEQGSRTLLALLGRP
jgi:Holliday junction resolvase